MNNFWSVYPITKSLVTKEMINDNPNITTSSLKKLTMKCPECLKSFSISPKILTENGTCLHCKRYIIVINKNALKTKVSKFISETDDYNDFQNKLLDAKFKPFQIGYIFEYFANLYFSAHSFEYDIKKYVSYATSSPTDVEMLEKIGLPKRDLGTDAVIFHNDDSVSLVQVKWRSRKNGIDRSALKGMSTDGHILGDKLRYLYIFSNTSIVSSTLPSGQRFKYILFREMLEIDWNIFASLNKKEQLSIDHPIEFRDWQVDAINFVKDKDICTIVAPCGAGKTLFAYGVMKDKDVYKILIVVPTLQLLSQWFRVLASKMKDTLFILFGRQTAEDPDDVPWHLTTDENNVSEKIRNTQRVVVISTYHSLDNIVKNTTFDIIFADEAHVTTGTGKFTLITSDIFEGKKIYLTATPRIYIGREEQQMISMDDKEIYGDRFTYSCRKAIEDGILSEYKVILGHCKIEPGFPNRYALYIEFLSKCIEEYGLKRILVASNSHAQSKQFYDLFVENFGEQFGEVVLMKGNAMARDKNNALLKMKSGPCIIFNVRVFNLGTDIPELDAVFFNGDKGSKIDIVQTSMRCLRKFPGKDMAYILIPAFFGDTLEVEDLGDYPLVRNTLSALGEQDSALQEEIIACAVKIKLGSGSIKEEREGNIIEFVNLDDEMEIGDIELRVFDRLGQEDSVRWHIRFEQVREYCENEGKCPSREIEKIGNWCHNQRRYKRKGKLLSDRIEKLESIYVWFWIQNLDNQWNENFEKVRKYCENEEKCPSQKIRGIGSWCLKQRQDKKNKRLSLIRIKILETIPAWFWDFDKQWTENFEEVKKYCKNNGNSPSKEIKEIGSWCDAQRTNKRKGKLSQERIKKLESIQQWCWNKFDEQWNTSFENVKKYWKKEGKCPVGTIKGIGPWCDTQRVNKRKGKLSRERIEKLETISEWKWVLV